MTDPAIDKSTKQTTVEDSLLVTGGAGLLQDLKAWDVVAFLGLLILITTLAYEYGRAAYWGFPAELVQFTSENALATFVRLAAFSLLGFWIILICRHWKWYRIFVGLLCALVAVLGSVRIVELWGLLGLVLALAGIAYSTFGLTALWKPNESAWTATLHRTLGKGGIALSVVMILVPYAGLALGYASALYQRDFIVATTATRRIVLATYGSNAVCATLNDDQTGRWISKSFSVVDLSSDQVGNVTTEHVGRVQVRSR